MENNKISVKKFVDTYMSLKTDEAKSAYMSSIIETTYLGYGDKMESAKRIIESTSWEYDDAGERTSTIKFNSSYRFVLFVFTVVNKYTKIHMDNEKMLEEFDLLNKNGLIEVIFIHLPEDEIKEFETVIQTTADDFLNNNYGIQGFVQNQITRIGDVIVELAKTLSPVVEQFGEKLENITDEDVNKIIKLADRFVKNK